MKKKCEIKFSDLRSICDPKMFSFKNTTEVDPLDKVIGQERAVQVRVRHGGQGVHALRPAGGPRRDAQPDRRARHGRPGARDARAPAPVPSRHADQALRRAASSRTLKC